MADIKIKDLEGRNIFGNNLFGKPQKTGGDDISGADLFSDSENFTIELNDEYEQGIFGGMRCTPVETCYYSVLV